MLKLSAVILLALATPALALTPEEVWQNWQDGVRGSGQSIRADSTTRDGDTLVVRGVTTRIDQPDGGFVEALLDRIAFRGLDDGNVEVRLDETFGIEAAFADAAGAVQVARVRVVQPDAVLTASGVPGAISYAFDIPTFAATLEEFGPRGGPLLPFEGALAGREMAGLYTVSPGADGLVTIESGGMIGALSLQLSGTNGANTDETFAFSAQMAGIDSRTDGRFAATQGTNLAQALKAGVSLASQATVGAVTWDLDWRDGTGGGRVTGALDGMGLDVAMDARRLDYGYRLTGGDIRGGGPGLGLPDIATRFAEFSFGLGMPVSASDSPQDFRLATRLVEATLNEEIWALLDPGQMLDREPVTVVMDVAGTGALAVDIMDPRLQTGELPMPEVPGRLDSLTLSDVRLKGLGTEVDATGALTFDNADLVTFDGVPAPTGSITVTLRGINALIEVLVSLGVIPEDDLMGLRLGLAMFAKPGAQPDELISAIEFRDRQLILNGQRMR